jgi:glycogen(starch) synthase
MVADCAGSAAMKILAFTPFYLPFTGGIEVLVDSLAEGLRNRSIETVIVTDAAGVLPRFDVVNGTRVHRFEFARSIKSGKPSQPLLVLSELARTISEERPDVVHLHSATQVSAFYLDRLLRKLPRRPPLITTQHGILERIDQMNVTRSMLLNADVLTAVSDAALDSAIAFSRRTAPSLRIYNGIPKLKGEHRHRTIPDRHTLLCVGRMQREKGFDTAIEALPKIRNCGLDATLVLIGDGEDRAELGSLARGLGIPEHVIFRGSLDRKAARQAIAKSSVLLVPSRTREGFSLVAAEAALAGTPCVASNVGGLPETVQDGISGYIVRTDDPAALADAAVKLLRDRCSWLRMSIAARRRAQDIFEMDLCIESYFRLYKNVKEQDNSLGGANGLLHR